MSTDSGPRGEFAIHYMEHGQQEPDPDPYKFGPGWEMTCYGDVVDEFDELEVALRRGAEHIRDCPQGAMPWATKVEWHEAPRDNWSAAANGEWLNHHVRPLARVS